jgi:hypothetical protein
LNYAAPFVSTNIYSFAATSSSEATTRSAIAAAAAAKGAARSRESQSAVIAPVQKSSAAASGSTSIHSDVLGQLSAQRPSLFVSLSISNSLNASETANLFVGIDFGYSLKALQHDLLDLQHGAFSVCLFCDRLLILIHFLFHSQSQPILRGI